MGTIAVSAVLAAVVISIILKMRKDKRSGISSCGCKCAGCANCGVCHGEKTAAYSGENTAK